MLANQSVPAALSLIENDKSKVLGLTVGKHTNIQPGQYIPRADAQSPPELTLPSSSPTTTYMAVCLDLDAPFGSFSVLSPILHWLQPGLQATPAADGGFSLKSTAPFVANWAAPGPPPGAAPHRYVVFLYEQPTDFDGTKHTPPNGQDVGLKPRIRYNLDAWMKEAKLGPVMAVNYFKSN